MIGTKLAQYEIERLIGAGGMGEVYRARDTKLGRQVAIKVLPKDVALDPERTARFEREAQVLAALNHPHIAHLHSLEQATPSADQPAVQFLVMELVEGETLAERLQRGPLPVEQALRIARQIAEALEAAHEKGIVHRDLKPANVKITPDEQTKVLDFGLAKAMETAPPNTAMSNSPTLSLMATNAGMILGTASYMSPEQAKGAPADQRSDFFSFGAVLYEMLAGRPPFKGDTVPEILASVLVREADFAALPSNLNPRLYDLLKRCLDKNPKQRWQAAGDLRAEIEAISAAPHSVPALPALVAREPLWRRLAFTAAPAAILAALIAFAATWFVMRPAPGRVTRLTITAPSPAAALVVNGNDRDIAISPDGTHVAYVGGSANQPQLFVRALDQLEPTPLAAGSTARGLFFSPDGQWIGFADATGVFKKVALTGGPAVTLGRTDGAPRGATWSRNGTIIFATGQTTGLQQMSEGGGEIKLLTTPNTQRGELDHLWPELLPDGRKVLFTISSLGGTDESQLAILDLQTGAQKIVLRGGSHAHYLPTGHLVYGAAGTLRAVPFDVDRLETTGTPIPVLSQVFIGPNGAADFDVADDGTLAYVSATQRAVGRTLAWVDRQGHETPINAPPRAYVSPHLSPDGTRIALDTRDEENDIWIWEFARATLTRLTFDPKFDGFPVWTPDSRRILFTSARAGVGNIFWQAADGTGTPEQLTESSNQLFPTSISPDGTQVVFRDTTVNDVMMLTLDKDRRVQPLVRTPFNERNGEISPDGRWLAYESNDSGRFEIYVRPFPDVNSGRWQVSTSGGLFPLWARNGRELFYTLPAGGLMQVSVERATSWTASPPTKLLDGPYAWGFPGLTVRAYDISPDGSRFLLLKPVGGSPDQAAMSPSLIVVQNFFEELRRLVPTR
jgi:Tol biopolymer transport system component